jgi:hypothetical protein
MNTARRILLVFVLCVLAVAYLYQHNYSMKLTRNLSRLETERQLLSEKLDSVDADIVKLSSFVRMDSLWIAQGRPAVPVERLGPIDGQPVALVRRPR